MAHARAIATLILLACAGLAGNANARALNAPEDPCKDAAVNCSIVLGVDRPVLLGACPTGATGYVVAGVRACMSRDIGPEPCPEGYVGQVVNGEHVCVAAASLCDAAGVAGQWVAWDLEQKMAALEATGTDVPPAEQVQDAARALTENASLLCLKDIMEDPVVRSLGERVGDAIDMLDDVNRTGPIDDLAALVENATDAAEQLVAQCVEQTRPGWAAVSCWMFCDPWPDNADYYVNTKGMDPASSTTAPLVYAAVGCFQGGPAMPPFGTSCMDNGYCYGRFAEGVSWLHGFCHHVVFGNEPAVVGRKCSWD